MRPLTDAKPKPLLQAGRHTLIEYQIKNLARAGFSNIVINHAYLGNMIEEKLGHGKRYGIQITYSPEHVVLETAGGIANALSLLTDATNSKPFLVVNADIYCEFNYAQLHPVLQAMHQNNPRQHAHLVLVDNPIHHAGGDFALVQNRVVLKGENQLTFSGIGVYHPALFNHVVRGHPAKLAPVLRTAISQMKITGEYFTGTWMDIGTPERLEQLHRQLCNQQG